MSDPDGHSSNGSTDSSNDSLNGGFFNQFFLTAYCSVIVAFFFFVACTCFVHRILYLVKHLCLILGSWVKLDASDRNGSSRGSSEHPISAHNGKMEDLLAEAVADESRANGTHSDREGYINIVFDL